jgi:hypothetical protein
MIGRLDNPLSNKNSMIIDKKISHSGVVTRSESVRRQGGFMAPNFVGGLGNSNIFGFKNKGSAGAAGKSNPSSSANIVEMPESSNFNSDPFKSGGESDNRSSFIKAGRKDNSQTDIPSLMAAASKLPKDVPNFA